MGARGSLELILPLLLAAWISGEAVGFHLAPALGPPSVTARLDSVMRDSLRARVSVELFPLDSVRLLQEEGRWPQGERTASEVSRLLEATHRSAAGWLRLDPLDSDYHRTWLIFWAKRTWILRGEAFRATGEGIVSKRFSAEVELPQGFVGTSPSETHPVTSKESKTALDLLSRLVAKQTVPFLLGSGK